MWNAITRNTAFDMYRTKASNLDLLYKFADANGFDRYCITDQQAWHSFLTQGRNTAGDPKLCTEQPPYIDHPVAFKDTQTNIVCLTYHPYQHAETIAPQIASWASSHGLEAEVYNSLYSWYYPNNTCLVVLHLPGVQIRVEG